MRRHDHTVTRGHRCRSTRVDGREVVGPLLRVSTTPKPSAGTVRARAPAGPGTDPTRGAMGAVEGAAASGGSVPT